VPRDPLVYLEDIVTACDRVFEYTRGMSAEAFRDDQRTIDAVLRNLEIIGEAAKNVPDDVRAISSEIDWRRIAGLRDILAHQYFAVNLATVWDIVQTGLKPLSERSKRLLSRLEPGA
jgi:uncharacterized protein with HEPN domain